MQTLLWQAGQILIVCKIPIKPFFLGIASLADWPSSDDHWADIPSWGRGWGEAGQVESSHTNGWGQANVEAPPRKRNVGDAASSSGFFGATDQQANPYPSPFTAFNPQNHSPYGHINPPHSHPLSFGSSSYGQSHQQYAKSIAPYRTTQSPYKTSAAPYQPPHLPFNQAPTSYSKPPSPYSFPHQPYKSHFEPTPTPYSAPAVPPPYSRPPYNPKANYRPAPGNSLSPLRVTPPDFGSDQFQLQQSETEGTSSGEQSPKERPSVFERSVRGFRNRGRDRPGRGLAPPRRPGQGPGQRQGQGQGPGQGQGQGQGPGQGFPPPGRQQRPPRPNFPPGRSRPPPFTNRAVIPFRDLRRPPAQQKREPPPNAIVGDPFGPIDPSFDFANDFKEFEEEGDEMADVDDNFFQDSDDNPFGRPGFPHQGPNSRGAPPKKANDLKFDGQPVKELGSGGDIFDDEELENPGFERSQFEGRGFSGGEKEAKKRKRENSEMGRKRKEELPVEPLDFRYSTIGLELFKASRGAQNRKPDYRKPDYRKPDYREPDNREPYRQPESQPTNLPQSG